MIRILAAASVVATLALTGAASAQTYGQPIYLDAWGRPIGGSPLSEVETRPYVETGRWADGYSDRPYVYVPGQAWDHRYAPGYRYERRYARSYPGYRDAWGYNDDRPRASSGWSRERPRYRGCDCGDVYLYDR